MSARSEFEALKQGLSGLTQQGYINKAEEEEEFVPPDNLAFSPLGNGENYDYNATQEEQPQYTPNNYDDSAYDPVDENDEVLWYGGPLKSQLESWKKQYGDIYLSDDIDPNVSFVYRAINRYEYKAIVATMNTDPLMREEMICEQCVLFPYNYSYGSMSNGNAGNVSTLSEQILMVSGFTKTSIPRRL